MDLVFGHDQTVAEWAAHRLGVQFEAPYSAFGVIDQEGNLVGASIFGDHYAGGNIEFTYVGAGTLSRRVQNAIAHYAFVACGASRLSAKTKRSNSKTVGKMLHKAGFAFEGIRQRYYGPSKNDDALCFVLFRDKAGRWLGEETDERAKSA